MSDKRRIISKLAHATFDHDPDRILELGAAGERFDPSEAPVHIVAYGVCARDLDAHTTQTPRSIHSTLGALKKIGVNLNEPIDGEPPAFHLADRYIPAFAYAWHYDRSQAALNGVTDVEQMERLKVFAQAGIDMKARNSAGKSLPDYAADLVEHVARKHAPRSLDPSYASSLDTDDDFQPRPFPEVREQMGRSLGRILDAQKQAALQDAARRKLAASAPETSVAATSGPVSVPAALGRTGRDAPTL